MSGHERVGECVVWRDRALAC